MLLNSQYLPTSAPQTSYVASFQSPLGYLAAIAVQPDEQQVIPVADPSQAIAISGYTNLTSVTANGQIFTPAVDPQNPQFGEFVFNPYSQSVQLYGGAIGIRSIVVQGNQQVIPVSPAYIPGPYPDILANLPCTGNIRIIRTFQQQPRGAFSFLIALDKSTIEEVLAPGTEFDFFGLPMRIDSLATTELSRAIYGQQVCKVDASLGCAHENALVDPVYLRDDGKQVLPISIPFSDPDCSSGSASSNTSNLQSYTTVNKLLAKAGLNYQGPALKTVPIPKSTPQNATVDPSGLLADRALIAGGYVYWSSPAGVEIRKIGSQQNWFYDESQIIGENIQSTYEAIAKPNRTRFLSLNNLNPPQPNLTSFPSTIAAPPTPTMKAESPKALGFEYGNSELTGEFTDSSTQPTTEQTQGQSIPTYTRKESTITTRIDGDANANLPPDGDTIISNPSQCFDNGGNTRARSTVTVIDGADAYAINEIWGYAFTCDQLYDSSRMKMAGNPTEYWQVVEQTSTQWNYDSDTNLELSIQETGWKLTRFQKETIAKPETLLSSTNHYLYEFSQTPLIRNTSRILNIMPGYSTQGAFDFVKVCNKDGTSSLQAVANPNFHIPYYVSLERVESSCYNSTPNPSNASRASIPGAKMLPDLIVGEVSMSQMAIALTEPKYRYIMTDANNQVTQKAELVDPQTWQKTTSQLKAQGESIAEAQYQTTTESGTGDPPVFAKQKPDQYTQNNANEQVLPDQSNQAQQQFKYLIQTEGYSASDPTNGTENFPLAETLTDALTAARTKLTIENWLNGYKEDLQINANIQIAEGDGFSYMANGEIRNRVVRSATTDMEIKGNINGVPQVVGTTSLELAPFVQPSLQYQQYPVPKQPNGNSSSTTAVGIVVASDVLGYILPWGNIRSRGNP